MTISGRGVKFCGWVVWGSRASEERVERMGMRSVWVEIRVVLHEIRVCDSSLEVFRREVSRKAGVLMRD